MYMFVCPELIGETGRFQMLIFVKSGQQKPNEYREICKRDHTN